MLRAFVSTCALAALVCGLNAPAAAHTFDRRTFFTFNQPVTLPGMTLPAGTYTFRLADEANGRGVVQVLNGSGTQSFAMLLSIPAFRPHVPEESEITFMETGAGVPAAVKTWWFEGSTRGHEFIYPKAQALKLTQGARSPQAVARTRSGVVADPRTPDASSASAGAIEPAVTERARVSEPARVAQQQGEPAQPAPASAQDPAPTPADTGVREQLPQTASFIPLAVALGTLMLFGGAWLRRKAKL